MHIASSDEAGASPLVLIVLQARLLQTLVSEVRLKSKSKKDIRWKQKRKTVELASTIQDMSGTEVSHGGYAKSQAIASTEVQKPGRCLIHAEAHLRGRW